MQVTPRQPSSQSYGLQCIKLPDKNVKQGNNEPSKKQGSPTELLQICSSGANQQRHPHPGGITLAPGARGICRVQGKSRDTPPPRPAFHLAHLALSVFPRPGPTRAVGQLTPLTCARRRHRSLLPATHRLPFHRGRPRFLGYIIFESSHLYCTGHRHGNLREQRSRPRLEYGPSYSYPPIASITCSVRTQPPPCQP